MLIKYKPVYKVSISGEEIGYVKNKEDINEKIKKSMIEEQEKVIESIDMKEQPKYELKFANRTLKTNEDHIINKIKENNIIVTYKYYEIALDNEKAELVNTLEEAEEVVQQIKETNKKQELNLSIIEKYTQKEEEVQTKNIETAKENVQTKITEFIEKKKEEERIKNMPDVKGIKLATKPVSGIITSRYGVSSKIRKSTHTGLDIAATTGTPIKSVSEGTVTFAAYNGAFGKLVRVNHGNGVETWYAHCNKIYVKVGQKVNANDVIAAVGSTGNSTGPHLHFEIRINGVHVNPQLYLYK